MERRDAIKYTAFFMGASLSASTLATLLEGCKVDTTETWVPAYFSSDEAHFISELGETILPKTTTPGAKDAMVERYLDTVRPLRFSADENAAFKRGVTSLMQQANKEIGKDFVSASPEKRLEWVTSIDKTAYAAFNAHPEMPIE